MLGPILFFSISISANLINKKVTAFSWVADPVKLYSGKCYEYDVETGGKAFQAVTRKSKCRPKVTDFIWVASTNGVGGKCYEVDGETKGSLYGVNASANKCVTKSVSYLWELKSEISGECYQVDGVLRRKVSKNNCAPKKVDHHWIPRKSGWGGKCYAVDSFQGPAGYIESVAAENCRPAEVAYTLDMKKEGDQGYCYEVDSQAGAKSYSRRVSRENCFNQKSPEFLWKGDASGIGGECLEVRKSIGERVSSRKVDYKKCINFPTKVFFKRISNFGGICLIVDRLTMGDTFSNTITHSNCREQVKEFQYVLLPNEFGKPVCVESDLKTSGDLFVQKVSLPKCEDAGGRPKWILEDNGWNGRCVELRALGDKMRERSISKEKCRPSKTKIIWHNFKKLEGNCFEVDAVKGNDGFVVETSLKKCAPKFKKYIFYREEGKNAGHCYLVDRETSGVKFNKLAGPKKCKQLLIKVPK